MQHPAGPGVNDLGTAGQVPVLPPPEVGASQGRRMPAPDIAACRCRRLQA